MRPFVAERRAVGKIAKTAIAIVVVLVALIAIGAAFAPPASPTTTTSNQVAATTPLVTSSPTQNHFPATATGALTIVVTRATVDQTITDVPSGYTIYIYDVMITNTDSTSHLISMAAFKLITATNSVDEFTLDLAAKQNLPSVTLSQGQHVEGEVAFQVQSGEQPAKLEYSLQFQGVDEFVSNLPKPEAWISSVTLAKATMQSGAASNYYVSADIQNATTGLYWSTDSIPIKIAVTPLGNSVQSITIANVTVGHPGFTILRVVPRLPITVVGNGQEVDFVVYLSLPQSSITLDTLPLTLTTN